MLLMSCSSPPSANNIIDKAIKAHGGERFQYSKISFNFRGTPYSVKRNGGQYRYERMISDSLGTAKDLLTNSGFKRIRNDSLVSLSAKDSTGYANGLNSVIYFTLLPYKLNDGAVNKELLGESTIKGEPYYKIEVTFDEEGGGTDSQDRFMYWIHQGDYTMDYFAYRYHVNEQGTRFREAKNIRTIKGIRFADYNNFGSEDMENPLRKYDTYFNADTLNKVSEVNIDSIEVELLTKDER